MAPAQPRGIHVQMTDGIAMQIFPVVIGVPGGPRVAPLGMPRPPDKTHPPAAVGPDGADRMRAASNIQALAVPLSVAPWCQESIWPLNSTYLSGSSTPGRSATARGTSIKPTFNSVCRRTFTGPFSSRAASLAPSFRPNEIVGVLGQAVSGFRAWDAPKSWIRWNCWATRPSSPRSDRPHRFVPYPGRERARPGPFAIRPCLSWLRDHPGPRAPDPVPIPPSGVLAEKEGVSPSRIIGSGDITSTEAETGRLM